MDNWIIPNDNFWRFNRARLIFWPFEWPKPTIFDDGIGSNIFLYEDLCSVWPDCDVFQQMQAKLWAILKTSIFKCGYCLGNFEKHLYNILFQHLEHLIIKLLYSVSLELFFEILSLGQILLFGQFSNLLLSHILRLGAVSLRCLQSNIKLKI